PWAVRLDLALVQIDDPLRNREPEPQTAVTRSGFGITLLECVEYARLHFRFYTDTSVMEFDHDTVVIIVFRDYVDRAALGCKLDGITQDIPKNLLQPGRVSTTTMLARFERFRHVKFFRFPIGGRN